MQKKSNGNSEEETCFKVVFRWRHISSKFDQDVVIFFDGGYKLKSEESSSLTKFWAIEEETKSNPSPKVEPIPISGRPKRKSDPYDVILFGCSILVGKEMWLVSSRTRT